MTEIIAPVHMIVDPKCYYCNHKIYGSIEGYLNGVDRGIMLHVECYELIHENAGMDK